MNTNTSAYLKRGKKALLMLAVKFCVAKAESDLPSLYRSIAYYNQHYRTTGMDRVIGILFLFHQSQK
jgi:hypothetical protein